MEADLFGISRKANAYNRTVHSYISGIDVLEGVITFNEVSCDGCNAYCNCIVVNDNCSGDSSAVDNVNGGIDHFVEIGFVNCREVNEESVFLVEELYSLLEKSKDVFSRRTLADAIISLCTKDAALDNCDDAVAKAKEYITRHFRENPGLKLCAEFVGLSPNYLAFCFKKQYGLSFKQYLTKCKLRCAKTFLENGASVTKACFDSGFESLSAFYTAFKNQNGVPPSKWKK